MSRTGSNHTHTPDMIKPHTHTHTQRMSPVRSDVLRRTHSCRVTSELHPSYIRVTSELHAHTHTHATDCLSVHAQAICALRRTQTYSDVLYILLPSSGTPASVRSDGRQPSFPSVCRPSRRAGCFLPSCDAPAFTGISVERAKSEGPGISVERERRVESEVRLACGAKCMYAHTHASRIAETSSSIHHELIHRAIDRGTRTGKAANST